MLVKPGTDRILGATIVSRDAGELLAELALAMKHGIGLGKLLGTVHAYPTMSEAVPFAAGEWKKAHKPERLLRLAQRFHAWRRGKAKNGSLQEELNRSLDGTGSSAEAGMRPIERN